jgi:serine O-acetyltransferase
LGKGLFLGAGAKIIGNKKIGDRVSISVDTVVYNREIGDDKVVMTDESGRLVIKNRIKPKCFAQNYFRTDL